MKDSRGAKERLIDEAFAHFEGGGRTADFSMRAVARAAGCSHANVYHYVDGSEGLMREAYLRALEAFRDHCVAVLASKAPRLGPGRAWSEAFVGFCLERPGLFRLLWLESLPGEARPEFFRAVGGIASEYRELVSAQLPPGLGAPERERVAETFFSYAQGCLSLYLSGRLTVPPRSASRASLIERLEAMWLLLTRSEPARRGG